MIYNKDITATVYVVHNGRVLLHMHKKFNTWFPVGGHLEPDELPHEAALREVKEEAGLDVTLLSTGVAPNVDIGRVDRLPTPFCLYREGDDTQYLDFIYIAVTDEKEFCPDSDESTDLRWFTKEELMQGDIKIHIKNTALSVLEYMEDDE